MSHLDMTSSPPSRPWSRFPARLVAARLVAGMPQLKLAKACGRTNSWVANLESGLSKLPREMEDIYALAQALGVDPEWLLFGRQFALDGAQAALGLHGDSVTGLGEAVDLVEHAPPAAAGLTEGDLFATTCRRDDIVPTGHPGWYLRDKRGRPEYLMGVYQVDGSLLDAGGRTLATSGIVGVCSVIRRATSPARPGR